jgi:asparagine synthase (glutamine-hydrolysing)
MCGLALIYHRDGGPVDRRAFDQVFASLDHRGSDGKSVRWLPAAALGHQHFWTTPEEIGERQPVADPAGRVHVAFDGRFDNRKALLAALDRRDAPRASDARLALWTYQRWGEDCFERWLGPFAAVIVDTRSGRVLCARDALGDRTLFYHLGSSFLAVASEERALLAHPAISPEINESSLARFFAVTAPRRGETFFADIREVPPAHALIVDAVGLRLRRHWQLDRARRVRYRRDEDYADHFRELLSVSVGSRLRSPTPPVVLMSGGLDSTAVAATAARKLAAAGAGPPLRTISWVFDELTQSDEREFIAPMVAACGLAPVFIGGDDAWPLRDLATWPRNPSTPLEGVFRRLMERSYDAVRAAGGVTLLTGDGGDELFTGASYWLRSLLAEGRLAAAGAGIWHELARGRAGGGVPLRGALTRVLGVRRGGELPPAWLTPAGAALLGDGAGDHEAENGGAAARPEQAACLLDPRSARSTSLEAANANRAGVDIRWPFRDRRLIEFVLAIPAHQLYRPGWTRWMLRQAMVGLLPEAVRRRRRATTLLPLCARGLVEREAANAAELLAAPDAVWRPYVRRDWLQRAFPDRLAAGIDSVDSVVAWRCICAQLWKGAVEGAVASKRYTVEKGSG